MLLSLALCLSLLPTAALAAEGVTYIQYSWNKDTQALSSETKSTSEYTVVGEDTTWGGSGSETEYWYVVNSTTTISSRVTVTGDVRLILEDNCTLTVSGGIQVALGNSLTIYGQSVGETAGTLVAQTGISGDAGIGGNQYENGGAVTIHGGMVNAGSSNGAGIGGGQVNGDGGTVTIYGGTVNASSSGSAGIGGGSDGAGGTVHIYGGTVTATSGGHGAGIGGGSDGAGGTVHIYGGTVTATSGGHGAGIGGGSGGAGGTVCIYGGTVNASSSGSGAGIGGGHVGAGNTITISGGTVTASSSGRGAGIGSGLTGDAGTFSTERDDGPAGNAVIFASSKNGSSISDQRGKESWSGVIFEGNEGKVYGTSITPVEDFSIPEDKKLTIETGKTLTIQEGVILAIYNKDCLTGDGTLAGDGTYRIASPLPSLSPASLTYNGKDQFGSLQLTAAEGGADTVEVMDQNFTVIGVNEWALQEIEMINAGEYAVQAICGALTTSYTVTVNPATLNITGATVEDKTYDGTTDATVTGVTFDGLQNDETLTLGTDYTATAAFGNADAGEGKTVTVTVTLKDTQVDKNYTFDGGEGTCTATASISPKELSLTLTPDKTELSGSGTVTLTLTGLPSDATVEVACSSDNTIQVTKGGNNTWTATLPNQTAEYTFTTTYSGSNYSFTGGTCKVKVTQSVTGVTLDKDSLTLTEGETATLAATVEPEEAINKTVTWSTSDESVATVDANGTVTAVSAGTATITVTTEDGGFTASCEVTVERPSPPANPNYRIDVTTTAGGTVDKDPSAAKAGETVTLTPAPDAGYEVGEVTVTDRFGEAVEVTENPDGTYTFTMPNGQVSVEVTFVEAQPEPLPFTDVAETDWFHDAVRYVYDNGLMDGVGDGQFAPNATTTRAQLVTILYRLAGEPDVSGDVAFTDVESGLWYSNAVAWAAQNGIVNGISETEFAPSGDLTREQLATILYRYAESMGYDVSASADLSGFPDADQIQSYATEALSWAVAEGLLQGFEDDSLQPQSTATRAQIATILMRFCEGVGA